MTCIQERQRLWLLRQLFSNDTASSTQNLGLHLDFSRRHAIMDFYPAAADWPKKGLAHRQCSDLRAEEDHGVSTGRSRCLRGATEFFGSQVGASWVRCPKAPAGLGAVRG